MSEETFPFEEKRRRGPRLTLLHLFLFVFSVGVVVGIGLSYQNTQYFVPKYLAREHQVGLAGCAKNLTRMGLAFEAYHHDHGKYPQSQYDLLPKYLGDIPVCPSAERVSYRTSFGPQTGNNKADSDDYFLIECCGRNHDTYWVKADYPAYDNIFGLMMEQGR